MELEILTKGDLTAFRMLLLEDIKKLLQPEQISKKWLRSSEVRKMLQISAGTLQNLRINSTLHPIRLENSRIWYYSAEEIYSLLNGEQKNNKG
jgi:hypothetical protein